jgi:hypothetical protein
MSTPGHHNEVVLVDGNPLRAPLRRRRIAALQEVPQVHRVSGFHMARLGIQQGKEEGHE